MMQPTSCLCPGVAQLNTYFRADYPGRYKNILKMQVVLYIIDNVQLTSLFLKNMVPEKFTVYMELISTYSAAI